MLKMDEHITRASSLLAGCSNGQPECSNLTLLPHRNIENGRRFPSASAIDPRYEDKFVFTRRNYDLRSVSSQFASSNKAVKRKAINNDCCLSPSRKQHITEEKMASCMQMLSLETDQDDRMMQPLKQENDDSDFEDDSDLEDDNTQEARHPVIQLHSDFKDRLAKLDSILPKSILENMYQNDACLALVPYVPPQEFIFNFVDGMSNAQQEGKEYCGIEEYSVEHMKVEDQDIFNLDWDTDSDDDLVLN